MLVFFTNLSLMEFLVSYLALFLYFSVVGNFGWFWNGKRHKNIQLMLEFLKGPFLAPHISYYTLMTFLMLSVILLSMLVILLSTLNVIRHLSVEMDGSVLEEKSYFMMLGLNFSSKLDSLLKPPPKIGVFICSVDFLSPEVALYLYKSTIQPSMEYCCHVWTGTPSCYMELLDKLQKRLCGTVGPSLAASLEPLASHQNVASLSLFYRYYFDRCSS